MPQGKTLWALTLVVGCLLMLGSDVGAHASATSGGSQFVGRSGTELTLGGAQWRFVAYNNYQLTSLPGGYDCGQALDAQTVDAVMQQAAAAGATVIRTWFFQSYYDLGAQGQAIHPNWTAFDRVLSSASRYGLKVIPVLVNEYPQCEPSGPNKNLGFFQSAYRQAGYGYPLSFLTYARTVAAHYASNSTIAFWQIGNELESDTPSGCDATAESQGAHALRSFADTVTVAIQAADPHHLVSLGSLGSGQCGEEGSDYQYVNAGAVDLCEYHDYGDPTHSIPDDGYNRLAQRIAQCRALGKPLFVGESGIAADVGDQGQSTGSVTAATLSMRAGFFAAKMAAAFNAGVVGYGIWDKELGDAGTSPGLAADAYDIGSQDPANAVTAEMARSFGAYPGTVQSTFEDGGLDGWTAGPGSGAPSLSNTTAEAWGGTHALAIALGSADPASVALPTPAGLAAGSVVTLHVFEPEEAPGGITATPSVSALATDTTDDVSGPGAETPVTAGSPTTLTPGWNVITWTVPASGPVSAGSLGLAFAGAGGWAGTLDLDDVAWSAPGDGMQAQLVSAAGASATTTTVAPPAGVGARATAVAAVASTRHHRAHPRAATSAPRPVVTRAALASYPGRRHRRRHRGRGHQRLLSV